MTKKPQTSALAALEELKQLIDEVPNTVKGVSEMLPYRPDTREDASFRTIRQGSATNALTKVKVKENTKGLTIDEVTGVATLSQDGLTLSVSDFNSMMSGLKTSTYKLLDALTVVFTESGAKSPLVTLPLDEYMYMCGWSDKKEARKQVNADLEALFSLKVSFKGKSKREQDFMDIRICDAKGIKNGIINFSYSQPFYNILMGYPVMPYPPQLWRLNARTNPNSFFLLRKISEHKNMNIGKPNEDIIAVSTLLKVAKHLPTYDEVMTSDNRGTDRRIIQPFERDLNALSDTLSWEYCHSHGVPLTDEELQSFDYKLFSSIYIHTIWNIYPDQTKRLEKMAEEKADKKKRSTKKKAPSDETERPA